MIVMNVKRTPSFTLSVSFYNLPSFPPRRTVTTNEIYANSPHITRIFSCMHLYAYSEEIVRAMHNLNSSVKTSPFCGFVGLDEQHIHVSLIHAERICEKGVLWVCVWVCEKFNNAEHKCAFTVTLLAKQSHSIGFMYKIQSHYEK